MRRPLAETMKANSHLIKENHYVDSRQNSMQYTPAPTIEVPYKPVAVENNQEFKENKSPNKNKDSKTEIPPKNQPLPDKGNLIPRIVPLNLNSQIKENKSITEVKDVPRNCPRAPTKVEYPKVIERVPITPSSLSSYTQNSHRNEFLKVKQVQYRNLGIIGKGMSGKVYRVQNSSNNELQAIKFVDLSNLDKEGIQGCLEEIRMLHKLQAPCIIRMFD